MWLRPVCLTLTLFCSSRHPPVSDALHPQCPPVSSWVWCLRWGPFDEFLSFLVSLQGVHASSCAWHTVRPKKWNGVWSRERFTARPCEEMRWHIVLKSSRPHKGLQPSILKKPGGGGLQGMWSDRAQLSDWLMMKEEDGVTRDNYIGP